MKSGMFGGDEEEIKLPDAPTFQTVPEAYSQIGGIAQQYAPLALGARENALANIGQFTPEQGFFDNFQPSNFGQLTPELFQQFTPSVDESVFGAMLERAKREAGQRASMSGIESAFPELFSRAISPTMLSIGQQLQGVGTQRGQLAAQRQGSIAELGQRQAELTLQGRQQGLLSQLGIDPFGGILSPLAIQSMNQDQLQKQTQFQRDMEQAGVDFAMQQQAQQQQAAGISTAGSIAGGIGGFMLGGPPGAMMGASLGGSVGTMFGGSGTPVNLQDAISFSQLGQNGGYGNIFGQQRGQGSGQGQNQTASSVFGDPFGQSQFDIYGDPSLRSDSGGFLGNY